MLSIRVLVLVMAAVFLGLATERYVIGHAAPGGSDAVPAGFVCGGSPLQPVVSEDFESFDPGDWIAGGDAFWDDSSEDFYLTTTFPGAQAGRLYYATLLTGCGFRAEFDYDMSGGTGADGMTLAIVTETDYPPAIGGGLDFCPEDGGGEGYAVEFDSFVNGGSDPAGQHVGIVVDCAGNQLASSVMPVTGEHHVVVDYNYGQINIYLDGALALDYTADPDWFEGYIGFTAATGGATNNHIVDNATFSVASGRPINGDTTCDGNVTGSDALDIAVAASGATPLGHEEGCFAIGTDVTQPASEATGPAVIGDVNCSDAADSQDVLAVLRHVAGLPPEPLQPAGCVAIGELLPVVDV